MKILRPRTSHLVVCLSFSFLTVWGIDSAMSQSSDKRKPQSLEEKKDSEMVEIRFSTRPRRIGAKVIHGKDMLGITPFVLELPKDSGFRDVRVIADGFITLNTRFHTFKDHKRAFKMVKNEDAHTMLGYKHLPPDAALETLDAGVPAQNSDAGISVTKSDAGADATKPQKTAPSPSKDEDGGVKSQTPTNQ